VVQQQAGALRTAAEAEVGTWSGTLWRPRTAVQLAAVGVTPLTQAVLVTVLARRAFRYAVQAVLGIGARVASPGTLQLQKWSTLREKYRVQQALRMGIASQRTMGKLYSTFNIFYFNHPF